MDRLTAPTPAPAPDCRRNPASRVAGWRLGLAVLACLPLASPVAAQDDVFASRPAFSAAERPARSPATCADVADQLAGLDTPLTRIDMSIAGVLTLARTDGALWYLAVCSSPGVRVLCITYEGNGMKSGDAVVFRGGYNRQDDLHVVLDPCLASRP